MIQILDRLTTEEIQAILTNHAHAEALLWLHASNCELLDDDYMPTL